LAQRSETLYFLYDNHPIKNKIVAKIHSKELAKLIKEGHHPEAELVSIEKYAKLHIKIRF
jgi:hypothetical protein